METYTFKHSRRLDRRNSSAQTLIASQTFEAKSLGVAHTLKDGLLAGFNRETDLAEFIDGHGEVRRHDGVRT